MVSDKGDSPPKASQVDGIPMRIGEVSLLTNDVVRLANFYKKLLDIHNGSDDPVHQTLIGEETMLTIYDDGSEKNNQNQNICLVTPQSFAGRWHSRPGRGSSC